MIRKILLIFGILLIQGQVYSASLDHEHLDNVEQSEDEYVIVNTVSGNIRGKVFPAVGKQGKVVKFLGIPYAEKPIGNLRFSDPVPKEPWDGTINTLHHGSTCNQPLETFFDFPPAEVWIPKTPINEDCLYLDVWSPYPTPKNTSVMVWIYGGGFNYGTSSLSVYNGEILAGYTDVIVVSFNYRIGAFGFLATGDDRLKGNFGMKDQVLALKWVKNNIARFDGNPDSVTIFGQSAGASSVGYHLLSPMSQNLFHKAIMLSGIHGADYAFSDADDTKATLKKVLSYVNCPDDENMLPCLREVPAAKLNQYVNQAWGSIPRFIMPFMPVIDGEFITEDPNFSTEKNNLKKIPLLINLNRNEASFVLLYYYSNHFHLYEESCISRNIFIEIIDDIFKDLSPNTLEFSKYLYTDWTDSASPFKNRDALDYLIGDRKYICPIHHFLEKIRVYNSDVYLSEFNYRASIEVWPKWMGTYHGADLQFIFGHPFNVSSLFSDKDYSDKDRLVSKRIMTYLSNFAKFGNPNGDPSEESSESDANVTWPALHHKHQYLEITDELKIGQHYKDAKCQFWNEVVPALSHLSCSTH